MNLFPAHFKTPFFLFYDYYFFPPLVCWKQHFLSYSVQTLKKKNFRLIFCSVDVYLVSQYYCVEDLIMHLLGQWMANSLSACICQAQSPNSLIERFECPERVVGLFSPSKGPQRVVAIIQHPERVVAKIFCHNPFCAFLGAFWALKTLNERIRTLHLTYALLKGPRINCIAAPCQLEHLMSNQFGSNRSQRVKFFHFAKNKTAVVHRLLCQKTKLLVGLYWNVWNSSVSTKEKHPT